MRRRLLGQLEESLATFFGWTNPNEPAGKPAPEAPSAPPAPTSTPIEALDESVGALQALAREIGQRMRTDEPSHSLVGERPDLEKLKKEAAVHHQHIAEDILALHEKLGTGLTRAELEALQQGLTPLLPYLEREQGGIVDRTYFHVLTRILRETAAIAWDELMERMERAGLQWPTPGGLFPTASATEREAARERSLEREHQSFLKATPEHICDRVFGLVRIWRASYPPRDSDLWFQQCLLGVAWGRQLQLFETGAALLMGPEGEEVKAQLREAAQQALSQTRDVLKRGNNSLWDVNEMLVSTDRLASQLGPDLVWSWLEPRLDPARPASEPTLSATL